MLDENKINPLNTNQVGCVWEKNGKNGVYYAGIVNGSQVFMFPFKSSSDKAPKFIFIKPKNQMEDEAEC